MSAAEHTVLEGEYMPPETALDVYRPFYSELATLKQKTEALVFDYDSKQGIKDAKSYVFTLRKSRKPMKDAHDRAKADHLDFIRRVDGQYRELDSTLDQIIEYVERPIKEAEAREEERVAGHYAVLEYIRSFDANTSMAPEDIAAMLQSVTAVVVDESLEEFFDEAKALHAERIEAIQAALAGAQKREAEEAELAALRAEKAERDRRDHEARIAQEAADKAKAEAEAAAERGRIAAEAAARTEREAAEAREKAERARAERAEAESKTAIENAARAQREAEEREAQAVRDTEARIRAETEAQAAQERAEREQREADMEHRRTVNNEVLADLIEFAGVSEATGKMVITALFSGRVRHIALSY